ncbi:hypothetical protein [uncultured Desulfuromusa sp.]|uniref:hypothetical protein n=1 Tax=uncultured Desulfuromusa sp. TaxID=219183 RepID=UPI002AA64C85|nr:hypothetical protein [uncultured Desulfuromusa sp.]
MFIQHKQLKNLNVPAEKVTHLHVASGSVQLAFAGYPPQLCQAYLLQISGGSKVLIVVAFYLEESQSSIFFVPKFGELPVEDAEAVYEEGYSFIESMGFVLNESDFHLLSDQKKRSYWSALPISQLPKNKAVNRSEVSIKKDEEMLKLRRRSLESLGRFFASL